MIGQAQRLSDLVKNQKKKYENSKKILAVASGKGGTGKSFFIINYAYQLSQMGKRVLLIDLDSNLSNIDVMLNLSSEKTIDDFFQSRVLFNELPIEVRPRFDLIFGDSGKLNHSENRREMVDYLFTNIRNISDNYDNILIDTGAGIQAETLHLLSKADLITLIINPDPTSVMDGYALTKLFINEFGLREISVVVNKCEDSDEGKLSFDNLNRASTHFLKANLKYLGFLNYHHNVYKTIKEQTLFSEEYPDSEICDQLKEVANKLSLQQN